MFKSLWWRGGVWLTGSAVISKFLGLWRDRLILSQYPSGDTLDAIFTSFRLPDFFFFLFIGGTISTVMIPRLKKLSEADQSILLQGIFIRTGVGFGLLCVLGVLASPLLVSWIGKGLDPSLYPEMVQLSRWLFGSVFLLSLTSVLVAFLQSKEQFRFLAIGPVVYTLSICLTILYFGKSGTSVIGQGAMIGSGIYFLGALYFCKKEIIPLSFRSLPEESRKDLGKDFTFRVLNNSAFQINQTIDIFLAGFLLAGAVGAFSMGTALGSILLTILGIPLANTFFPRIADQSTWKDRWKVLKGPLVLIWLLCVPASIIGIVWASAWLELVYGLSEELMVLTLPVFVWTIASLPMMCSIPLLSRTFHAAGDSKTPLIVSAIALVVATVFAVWATFGGLGDRTILGLALANFIASGLSFVFFALLLIKRIYGNKI